MVSLIISTPLVWPLQHRHYVKPLWTARTTKTYMHMINICGVRFRLQYIFKSTSCSKKNPGTMYANIHNWNRKNVKSPKWSKQPSNVIALQNQSIHFNLRQHVCLFFYYGNRKTDYSHNRHIRWHLCRIKKKSDFQHLAYDSGNVLESWRECEVLFICLITLNHGFHFHRKTSAGFLTSLLFFVEIHNFVCDALMFRGTMCKYLEIIIYVLWISYFISFFFFLLFTLFRHNLQTAWVTHLDAQVQINTYGLCSGHRLWNTEVLSVFLLYIYIRNNYSPNKITLYLFVELF